MVYVVSIPEKYTDAKFSYGISRIKGESALYTDATFTYDISGMKGERASLFHPEGLPLSVFLYRHQRRPQKAQVSMCKWDTE